MNNNYYFHNNRVLLEFLFHYVHLYFKMPCFRSLFQFDIDIFISWCHFSHTKAISMSNMKSFYWQCACWVVGGS